MTLDEAIKHAEEVAEEKEKEAWEVQLQEEYKTIKSCKECAEEHRQLAEWLKELKQLREQTRWVPVSKDLPKDFGTYLITLENGDVCKCEFNPDFIDEEHENGAFTYYHQYFDQASLGMIDEEEEAVDAIAWMPFEPYDPHE